MAEAAAIEEPKTKPAAPPEPKSYEHHVNYPHDTDPEIPDHFSMISAQTGAKTDHGLHDTLGKELQSHGYKPVHAKGNYGYDEPSWMVAHDGSQEHKTKINHIAWRHHQDAVVHSSKLSNEMNYQDGRKSWTGTGLIHGPFLKEYYTQLPSGHRFRLLLDEPKEPKAEKTEKSELSKAFLQPDGETKTDVLANAQPIHEALLGWGQKHLVPIPIDDPRTIDVLGRVLKIRKYKEDLYSGWLEHEGKQILAFERLTLPEVLQQLRSKLELYGKEDQLATPDTTQEPKESELEKPKEADKEIRDALRIDGIDDKLKALQLKVNALKVREAEEEVKETLSGKELAEGLEHPAADCAACERPSDDCVCYMHLPNPRVEFDFDKKRLYVFFKSEWGEEDRENFKADFVKRVGKILDRRRLDKAKKVLSDLRQSKKKA